MVVSSQEVEHGAVNIVGRAASGVVMEEVEVKVGIAQASVLGQPSSVVT